MTHFHSTDELVAEIAKHGKDQGRIMVAIVGPPGSGKSTLSDALCSKLIKAGESSVVVPMDGFHLDNSVLHKRGLFDRKGAPETFDTDGFLTLITRLKEQDKDVRIPRFDRDQDKVILDVETVARSEKILLVEGNYLLLNRPDWQRLHSFWDLSIFLKPPLEVLEQRLIQRWRDQGLSELDAERRALGNDIPNAELVIQNSIRADIEIVEELEL